MAEYRIGLDIGLSSIKAVVLSHSGKKPRLIALGNIPAPQPGILSEADIDLEAEAKVVKELLTEVGAPVHEVITALPESRVFTRVIDDLPYLSDEELVSAIRYSAEEFVPLPADQVNLNWVLIGRSKQKNQTAVFVVASPKNVINKYIKVLNFAKIKPLVIETEIVAAARALVDDSQFTPTTMIIQLGASTTDFAVVTKGIILLTRSISTGGYALTRAIAQYLNFEVTQAEEYKKTYGLLEDQLGGKIFQVLKPLVDLIISEAQRVMQAYQTKYIQNPIKRVVLTGGGAKLPGIVIYLANNLALEVQEADPWLLIDKDPSTAQKLTKDAPMYTIAVGLALLN